MTDFEERRLSTGVYELCDKVGEMRAILEDTQRDVTKLASNQELTRVEVSNLNQQFAVFATSCDSKHAAVNARISDAANRADKLSKEYRSVSEKTSKIEIGGIKRNEQIKTVAKIGGLITAFLGLALGLAQLINVLR
jgi:methylthioribose-1-phosphate isomerase